jgi:translation initiation factor eIF-2B subunit delta
MTIEEGKLEQMLWDIERDNVSGSVRMARKTAILVREAAADAEASGEDLVTAIDRWAGAAAKAHPFMALVRTVGRRARKSSSPEEVGHILDRLIWELDNGNQRIAEQLVGLFPGGGSFMTNSFSATVHAALRHMASSGKDIRAIVVESRPAREGVQLARALGEHGIPSTLIVDAGVTSFMERASAVFVGGDTVAGGFFVNKLGTHPLVLSASSSGVPVYLLASLLKLVPDGEVPETEDRRSPEEVESGAMENVTVENIYFERVPLKLVTGVVTEDGVLSHEDVASRVASL